MAKELALDFVDALEPANQVSISDAQQKILEEHLRPILKNLSSFQNMTVVDNRMYVGYDENSPTKDEFVTLINHWLTNVECYWFNKPDMKQIRVKDSSTHLRVELSREQSGTPVPLTSIVLKLFHDKMAINPDFGLSPHELSIISEHLVSYIKCMAWIEDVELVNDLLSITFNRQMIDAQVLLGTVQRWFAQNRRRFTRSVSAHIVPTVDRKLLLGAPADVPNAVSSIVIGYLSGRNDSDSHWLRLDNPQHLGVKRFMKDFLESLAAVCTWESTRDYTCVMYKSDELSAKTLIDQLNSAWTQSSATAYGGGAYTQFLFVDGSTTSDHNKAIKSAEETFDPAAPNLWCLDVYYGTALTDYPVSTTLGKEFDFPKFLQDTEEFSKAMTNIDGIHRYHTDMFGCKFIFRAGITTSHALKRHVLNVLSKYAGIASPKERTIFPHGNPICNESAFIGLSKFDPKSANS